MFVSLVYGCHLPRQPILVPFWVIKTTQMHTNFMVVTTIFFHVHLGHQNSPYTHQFIYVTTALVHAPLHTLLHDCHNNPCSCTFLGHQNSLYTHLFMAVTTSLVHALLGQQKSPYTLQFMVVITTLHVHLGHQNSPYTPIYVSSFLT